MCKDLLKEKLYYTAPPVTIKHQSAVKNPTLQCVWIHYHQSGFNKKKNFLLGFGNSNLALHWAKEVSNKKIKPHRQ